MTTCTVRLRNRATSGRIRGSFRTRSESVPRAGIDAVHLEVELLGVGPDVPPQHAPGAEVPAGQLRDRGRGHYFVLVQDHDVQPGAGDCPSALPGHAA